MDASRVPESKRPEDWLAWLADERSITTAWEHIPDEMVFRIVAYAVGNWIAENKQDELAERIAAEFLRLEAVLP